MGNSATIHVRLAMLSCVPGATWLLSYVLGATWVSCAALLLLRRETAHGGLCWQLLAGLLSVAGL